MFDEIYYAVQFENGKFFTGSYANREGSSEKIEDAFLYRLEFEIEKDLHLKIFFRSYGLKYKVVRVKVKKSFEVLK